MAKVYTCVLLFLLLSCHATDKDSNGTGSARVTASPESQVESIVTRADTSTEGMVWIEGGKFEMGCEKCNMPDAVPVHPVQVSGFWMDETPVTNEQFEAFVNATGYKTVAEQPLSKEEFPQLSEEERKPGSIVFTPPSSSVQLDNPAQWWRFVHGADWKHPEGPGSDIRNRMDHPVVHISYVDALAYCKWAGKRLPTEAEYEYASRGGKTTPFSWGDDVKPEGKWAANIWQGQFPNKNSMEDGFAGTSPVKAFPPNGYKLYDVSGNIWQWCSDWYRSDYFEQLADTGKTTVNPVGPTDSYDPAEPGLRKKVQKGGSFLCSDQYCSRYYLGSRGKGEIYSASSNVGFRCVK